MLQHYEVAILPFESLCLRDNPAGDPCRREIAVLIPRIRGAGAARFPVVYILAGYTSSGLTILNRRGWLPSFPEQVDRLRAQGSIGDIIVVLPDGFTTYGGSQYLNSTATGRYRDMIAEDLIPWIDGRFPTLAGARHRAVAGKSSGGFGALRFVMDSAGLFAAAACHSGDLYFEYSYRHDFPRLLQQIDRHGSLEKFVEWFLAAPKKTSDGILAMNIVAMAAAYSPNPSKPWRVDLPFDPHTGEIDAAVWARWLEHDPVQRAEKSAAALRGLRLLYLDCGSRDQFHLQYGLRIFRERLKRLGVPHQADEFDDDHTDTGYRYDISLPKIWEAIRP